MEKKVGIIGLGTVGEATLKSLCKYHSLIEKRTSLKIKIAKICDLRSSKKKLGLQFSVPFTTDPYELINDPDIDIIVELVGGINPAKDFITAALKNGKNVVTANKALLAQYGKGIFNLAKKNNKNVGFEASVCGAIPLIRSISQGLVGCKTRKLYGILNGTTNYILYKMDKEKLDFASALKEAQDNGFAEAKPDFDIKGIDALHKLSILSYLCFGVWPKLKNVYAQGITNISSLDVMYANELSYKIKLLAVARHDKGELDLRVHPALVPEDHPLAQVNSAFNAVWLDVHPAGELLFYGEGAGGIPTSSAVISDIVNISFLKPRFIQERKNIVFKDIDTLESCYYIRCMALDKPGVLAQISKVLSSFKISIASLKQNLQKKDKFVPITMITHKVKESSIKKAIAKIDKLKHVKASSQFIRIEDFK